MADTANQSLNSALTLATDLVAYAQYLLMPDVPARPRDPRLYSNHGRQAGRSPAPVDGVVDDLCRCLLVLYLLSVVVAVSVCLLLSTKYLD